MTEETWNIALGDRTFTVPRLPFKISRVVYPICQRLTNNDLPQRLLDPSIDKKFAVSDEEMDDLAKIALLSCQAASASFTGDEFDASPIPPPQLFDAFFAIRYACGGWQKITGEVKDEPGEE
jgi:hypothetical protein